MVGRYKNSVCKFANTDGIHGTEIIKELALLKMTIIAEDKREKSGWDEIC